MKLEPDLIREILVFAEGIPAGEYQDIPALADYDKMTVYCHARHLNEAGYLEAVIAEDSTGRPACCRITDLSWKGHEFLGLARNNEGWAWTKKMLSDKAIAFSFSITTRILEAYAVQKIGLS